MRIAVVTLGCKVNQSESAAIKGILKNENYELVPFNDTPDICIVNTCTVTQKSDYQSRQLIRKALKSGARVIATGCYAQLHSDELKSMKGLDFVIGNSLKANITDYVKAVPLSGNEPAVNINTPSLPLIRQPYFSNKARGFLKIQDGCNLSCSYCAVPLARGKSRSLNTYDVIATIQEMREAGYKEIVLTGIHIGFYGLDLKPEGSLLSIVELLIKSFPDIRFRLSSLEPQEVKKEFLYLIRDGKLCAHLHIPLQSGSEKILKIMRRGYTTDFYRKAIDNILNTCPDISIGTDIITGFPEETENEFKETYIFLNELAFSYFHVFPYSKRPNTVASLLKDQVPESTKKERVSKLISLSNTKRNIYFKKNLNKLLDVIVENKSKTNGFYNGISENYIKVLIKADKLSAGHRIKAKAISLTSSGMLTEYIKNT